MSFLGPSALTWQQIHARSLVGIRNNFEDQSGFTNRLVHCLTFFSHYGTNYADERTISTKGLSAVSLSWFLDLLPMKGLGGVEIVLDLTYRMPPHS